MNLPALSLSTPKGIVTFVLATVAALYVVRQIPQLRAYAGVAAPTVTPANPNR
jgi:hypothetical protein